MRLTQLVKDPLAKLKKHSHGDLVREVLIACNRLPGVNLFAVDVGGKERGHGTAGVPDIIGWKRRACPAAGCGQVDHITGRAIFFEIKVGRDSLRPKQRVFLELARKDNCIALEIRSVEDAINALR